MVSWGLLGGILDFTLLSSLLSDQSQHLTILKDVHFCLHNHHFISGPHYLSCRQVSPIVSKLVSLLFTSGSPEWLSIQYPDWFYSCNPAQMSPLTEWPNPKSFMWFNTAPACHSSVYNQAIHSLDIFILAKLVSLEFLKYTDFCTSSSLYPESLLIPITPDGTHALQKSTKQAQPLLYLLVLSEISPFVEHTHRTCTPFEIYMIFAIKSSLLSSLD